MSLKKLRITQISVKKDFWYVAVFVSCLSFSAESLRFAGSGSASVIVR